MEERISIDSEIDIPLSLIDHAEWNPKVDIHGVYKRGLDESLDYFGIRDRLKVWPDPSNPGRYICLNGNQRINCISEKVIYDRIKSRFAINGLCSDSDFNKVLNDPSNQSIINDIKSSISDYKVPCQVMTHLESGTKLTKEDAKLFTLVYDRNHAKYDEVKQAEEYRNVLFEKVNNAAEDQRKNLESRLKTMVRPELPMLQPASPSPDQPSFEFKSSGEFKPTEEEPWGPSPPSTNGNKFESNVSRNERSNNQESLVPLVLSLTQSGYAKITDSILRSKARLFREFKLNQALEKLEKLLPGDLDERIDSIVAETALLILDKHIEIESKSSE